MGRLIVLGLALLAGCVDTTRISLEDRSVFLPSARMSIDISPKAQRPAVPHSGHGLELGISGTRGDGRQQLQSGDDPVIFGGRTFNAPAELNHEFEFRFAEGAYRFRKFFGSSQEFGLEALAGLAYARLDLEVSSPTQRASEHLGSSGIVGGFGLIWKVRPTTSVQTRLTVFSSGDSSDVSSAARGDIYLVQALGSSAALRAGYAKWGVRSEREFDTDDRSAVRVNFSGFALGLDVMF